MKDNSLKSDEAQKLIERMVDNTKSNMRVGKGNLFMFWGYNCALTSLLVYVMTVLTGDPVWNYLWFLIPVAGAVITWIHDSKLEKSVLTDSDRIIAITWKFVFLASLLVAIPCLDTPNLYVLPVIQIVAALATCVSGEVLKEKWMKNTSLLVLLVSVIEFDWFDDFHALYSHIGILVFAICSVLMLVIPGHRLDTHGRK